MVSVLFIGGHPKGHKDAFNKKTLSGQRLRKILERNPSIQAEFLDVWNNQEEEDHYKLNDGPIKQIIDKWNDGYVIVALGSRVREHLNNNYYAFECMLPFWDFFYLPHPASRSQYQLELLELGIIAIASGIRKKDINYRATFDKPKPFVDVETHTRQQYERNVLGKEIVA